MFVVVLAGLKAVVKLAEELVEQVSLGLVVPVSGGAAGVVVAAGARRGAQRSQAQIGPTAARRRFLICRCSTTVFLPLVRVIGADGEGFEAAGVSEAGAVIAISANMPQGFPLAADRAGRGRQGRAGAADRPVGCAVCGHFGISTRDRAGEPRCAQCPDRDDRDPISVIYDVVARWIRLSTATSLPARSADLRRGPHINSGSLGRWKLNPNCSPVPGISPLSARSSR